MKIPKKLEKDLAKRGWTLLDDETWRKVRGQDWACAYFKYRSKVCLITVAKLTAYYQIQILYPIPVCSMYKFSNNRLDVLV